MYVFEESCKIPNLSEIYSKYFGYPSKGTFVEVGASDGKYQSNTYGLIKHGWRGIYIEPIPWMFNSIIDNYKQYTAVFENVSVGTKNTEVLFYEDNTRSTCDLKYQQLNNIATNRIKFDTVRVPQVTLDSILIKNSVNKNFELLIVDVNSSTEDVFNSFNVEEYKPKIIISCLYQNGYTYYEEFSQKLSSTNYVILREYVNQLTESNNRVKDKLIKSGYDLSYSNAIYTVFNKI